MNDKHVAWVCFVAVLLTTAGLAFAFGYHAGALDRGIANHEILDPQIDEFSFRQAQKVSKITGVDLYQVLTGRKGLNNHE